ncbi:MAG: cytidylate kinase [Sphingobacteriales bacterium 17-39-43]|uniref:(d)CMP kinase n=1 Tax=Daejeonella sp. TaxID=2805397 RepID=UPI000BD2C930|nr:(d)CMP kinase [Daejeonella sp.]OYZ33323.1 MAG: cytidylate kinase [Sphingobacteriales bacterium 16-39-50]OYZ57346.1 MAG: cytidylate kinase [Sphingobacteriales bacterium 24-40-4]OZA26732.1 MAG: cytidylate kinase [Sphingobacteriales bacterium 17-39-43]HQS04713.1 (d)CMP kinase [Daejeonella sp.]HQT22337.1 (d)CMP kinase [Daejeonella sp.]
MSKNIVIAIDGYSSCGKSTIAKALAKKLHFIYIDTGAMYRAVTLYFLRNKIDLNDPIAVESALDNIHINFEYRDEQTFVFLNEEDISEEIRQMPVSEKVSQVSAIKAVRTAMVRQQQRMGKSKNIIMDGRDIGTVVFPDATLKFFMTADPQIRAERRYKELINKGEKVSLEEIYANLALRDHQDTTREESPLIQAADAIVLDNSNIDQEMQLEFALSYIRPLLIDKNTQ